VFDLQGPDGQVRRGIWAGPAAGAAVHDTAVILLPAGLKYRVGAHRFNVLLARQLAAWGLPSLRIDPLGLGESDGQWAAAPLDRLWRGIEFGAFVEDTLLAVQAVRERQGVRRVLLAGLCGGAMTAVLAAARERGAVQGVVALGLPVRPTAVDGEAAALAPEVARRYMGRYLRKLVSQDAWARMLRGHSNWGAITQAMREALRPRAAAPDATVENPLFVAAFRELQQQGVPQLLLFGSADNRWLDFESTFFARELQGQMSGAAYQITLIPEASHELHFEPFKQQALAALRPWLQGHFGL
jgi:uncharacterized protein